MKEFKSKFTKLTQILVKMPLFNKDSSSYKSLSRAQFKELLSRTVHLWKSRSMVSKGYIQCTCRINLWNRKYRFTLIESFLKLAVQTVTEHRTTSTDRWCEFLNVYMTVQHCSFGKKIISCINLASQTSKLETWDSIFTSRNSSICALRRKDWVSSYFWGTVFSFSRVSKSVKVTLGGFWY